MLLWPLLNEPGAPKSRTSRACVIWSFEEQLLCLWPRCSSLTLELRLSPQSSDKQRNNQVLANQIMSQRCRREDQVLARCHRVIRNVATQEALNVLFRAGSCRSEQLDDASCQSSEGLHDSLKQPALHLEMRA